jgi:TetR/AcrR family transcriptional repressor of nem operon
VKTSRVAKELLREEILLSAIPFFKESGRSGAPVDKIMSNLGLTSGALYSHFNSKDDFFNQVVLREMDRRNRYYADDIAKLGGVKALEKWIDDYLSDRHVIDVANGCVYSALGSDLKNASPGERESYERKMNETFEILSGGFPSGSADERMARVKFIFSTLIGTLVLARSSQSKDMIRSLLTAAKAQLKSMIG